MSMTIVRTYLDDKWISHFEDIEIPLNRNTILGMMSADFPVKKLFICDVTPTEVVANWHTTPVRQYCIILDGGMQIEAGDGEVRVFGVGDVILLDDVDKRSKGHLTKVLHNKPMRALFVSLDEPNY